MSQTRVLLVRHGQSEWNAAGRWQGQADPPLTDTGRQQARAASRSIGAVDAVFASDLQRAAETAAIVSGELGVGPVVLDPDLRERDAGEWSGMTRAEIEERYPGYLGGAPSFSVTHERRPPGWEPDASVQERALRALRRIAEEVGGGDVLAVTHGGLIYAVEDALGHRGPVERLANGAGRWVVVDADGHLSLGDRVLLVDEHDAPVTVPGAI